MTSYFIVIYSCNTIGSQIVIVKDNNIESIHKLLEGQKAIKPMFFREDFSANELNRMRMRKAIRTDLNKLTKAKCGHLKSFLNRSTALIGSSRFLRTLTKVRLCKNLNGGEKIHISREHFKTTQYGIGYSKCILREVRDIVDGFILNVFESKIIRRLSGKHFSRLFKGGRKCFSGLSRELDRESLVPVNLEDFYQILLLMLLLNVGAFLLSMLEVIVFYFLGMKLVFHGILRSISRLHF